MARKDALLRLHQRLLSKRGALRKKLVGDDRPWQPSPRNGGDLGDNASEGTTRELNSQLAALENRELRQIERAIELIRDGRYGTCEHCNHSIPIQRLRAVPTTFLCVDCQRELEETGTSDEANWANTLDSEGAGDTTEVSLGELDTD